MNDPDVEQVKAALYTAPDDFPYEKLHSKASDAIYRISIRLAELEAESERLRKTIRSYEATFQSTPSALT